MQDDDVSRQLVAFLLLPVLLVVAAVLEVAIAVHALWLWARK